MNDDADDDDSNVEDDGDVRVLAMVIVTMRINKTMKVRGRRRKVEEYGGVRRRIRNSFVNARGARVRRYLLWTFGELAHITFDPDHAARSCTALRFHALPVHVRKGLKNERFA